MLPSSVYSPKFELCVNRVIGTEGGYKPATPGDPGGETNFGISKRSFPDVDIKNLTVAGAVELYHANHWAAIHGDDLPLFVAFQIFDFAVNSGPARAVISLQSALGVPADGVMGPVTMAAAIAAAPLAVLARFTAARLDFLASLENWSTNGAGWIHRIAKNLRFGALDLTAAS
jgi:lysozyme family protein